MPTNHRRGRLVRFACASLTAMLLGVLLLPVAALAQPSKLAGPAAAAAASNDCGGDTAGPEPTGSFSISGTVTDGLGAGIADIRVRASGGPNGLGETTTNPDGAYVLTNLEAAPYRLSFFDASATYQSGYLGAGGFVVDKAAAPPIDVTGDLTGMDVVLPGELSLTISGVVTDSLGLGVADVAINAVSTEFPMSGCGVTGADGTYAIPDVRVGQYRISLSGANAHPDGFYATAAPHFTTRSADSAVLMVTADRPGTDVTYPATFSISGTVQNQAALGVEGISLTACELPEGGMCASTSSGSDGSFTISTLVAGSYAIHQDDYSLTYTSGWHVPGGTVPDVADATSIAVAANVTGIQLVAALNPRISGVVSDAQAGALEGIDVSACSLPDSEVCASAVTDSGGGYVMAVNPGSYELRFSDPSGDRPSGYLGPADTLVVDQADARSITVGAADVPGVDITIPDGGRISGTVETGGAPAPFIGVGVCPSESACLVEGSSDDNGAFQTPAVLPGAYFLGAFTDEGERVWYVAGGPATAEFSSATELDVDETGVSGIVFDLPATEPPAQTPVGTNVGVVPVDPGTGATPIALTFDDVTVAGVTSLVVSTAGPGAPAGFQLGLPPTYYDISTTASFGGLVTVCISYAGIAFSEESTLRLFHYDSTAGTWQDRTVSHDLVGDVICGRTDSFSPFALFQRVFAFTEFFAPVDDLPIVNRAKAGSAIPVKFAVGGDFGLDILAEGSPASQRVGCSTGVVVDEIETTTTAGKSSLSFDASTGRYHYTWKTEKAWAKTCRMLILTFRDGTTARAAFEFK